MTPPNETAPRHEPARPPWVRHGNRPPWLRHAHARPPFGLHRRIFWSLVASTMVASLVTALAFRLWTPEGEQPSLWAAMAFGATALVTLWMASWRVSWRLVSPLNRVVRVVQELGNGDLSARAGFRADARDEVARVAHAIDTMADRLEQQVNDERTLLAVISHELRTPLARVRVLTAMAREGQPDAIEQIDREVTEIDDLVAKVLVRSRLMFGTMTMREVSMASAVREALERAGLPTALLVEDGAHVVVATSDSNAAQSGGARRGATLDTSAAHSSRVPATRPERADSRSGGSAQDIVRADPTLLHRAIANIIENAVRHGGGIDQVHVQVTDDEVLVDVTDRGPGFPDADPSMRFQAFTPQSGDSRGDGLGLGMHLIRQIVDAHEGRAWAENRTEGGAHVGFAFPRAAN
ncbi:MAG: HAMP domain-containing sensor histidine kinase [Vicinamibacterales bacterium]